MANKHRADDVDSRGIAIIDLLEEGGEARYNEVVNDPNNWIKSDGISIISHERSGRIYAIIQYYKMGEGHAVAERNRSPKEIVDELDKKTAAEMVEAEIKAKERDDDRTF